MRAKEIAQAMNQGTKPNGIIRGIFPWYDTEEQTWRAQFQAGYSLAGCHDKPEFKRDLGRFESKEEIKFLAKMMGIYFAG